MTHFHMIILGFNIIPALFAVQILIYDIKRCQNQGLRSIVRMFMVATILKSVTFSFLQYGWITTGSDEVVGTVSAMGWMLFDFLNGFTNLTFVLAIRLYLRWKNTPGQI